MKKKLIAVLAAGAITALTATSAMALENEFHGMYKFMGYYGNFFNGVTFGSASAASDAMNADEHSGFFAEQRARLQYIAKANDDLKLVTHFELDTRFGGSTAGRYQTQDSGGLDADDVTLETKSIYLDYNCPLTGANVKVGMQPWADSYQSLFLLADMTGAYVTKKFDPLTVSLGWFRFDDNTAITGNTAVNVAQNPGAQNADLYVLDAKIAATKDMTFGLSYYHVQNDSIGAAAGTQVTAFSRLNLIGANAALKFDPVTINAFGAYEFGEADPAANDISAYLLGTTAKVKIANGAINAAIIYLSGDDNGTGEVDGFTVVNNMTTYFNPANMWLLVRSGQAVNSSTSVLGNDLTVGGRGLLLATAGYEGTVGKIFYNANIGYGQTAEERGTEDGYLGTEINAQIGYKLYDNLSMSVAAGYLFLGDGLESTTNRISGFGKANADDPYFTNLQLSYTF